MPKQLDRAQFFYIFWDRAKEKAAEQLNWHIIATGTAPSHTERDMYLRGYALGWRDAIKMLMRWGCIEVRDDE